VLPTTLLMLVMVIFFFGIKDSPAMQAMLRAVRPVVVGLLLWTAYAMASSVLKVSTLGWPAALRQGWDALLITLAAFLLLTLTKVNPVFIILGSAVMGYLVYR
jgi:chromate transporter